MQANKSQELPEEVWNEIKSKHLEGVGLRLLARRYKVSEGTVLARAFRHRWSEEARLYKKICSDHHCKFRECPTNCGSASIWRFNVSLAKKRRAQKAEARHRKARKLQQLLNRPTPRVKLCAFCQKELASLKYKFCSNVCQNGHKLANKPPPKPRELWLKGGPPKKPNPPRKCPQCERAFTSRHPSSKTRFCSRTCSGARNKKVKPPPVEGNCLTCSTHIVFPKIKFCSSRCCKRHEKIMDKKLGRKRKKKPKQRKIIPIKPCAMCGNKFQPKSFRNLFCSHKCDLKNARNKRRIKERGKKRPPHQLVKHRLSSRLRELLRRKGQQKKNAINSYTGCTPMEMMRHVESQFTKGMTWETYGVFGWHLDHIIPCERFDLTNEDHCRVCFNWRNIRPLWGEDNWNRQEMLTLDEALNIDPELVRMATEVGVRLW